MDDQLERLGSDGAAGPEEASMKEELCMEIDPPFKENLATADDWRKALNKVVPAVVVLRTTACRAFDTESAGASYATGFVVDKRRGIILTNRHVVKPGPVVAEAMFVNREEIPVYPIYRDPVHDFGFFRYDPGAIQFLSYEEIPLAPEAACVGLEIRVVGNDSGEKVSILAGTLARLDRDAPHYKKDGYNDFNTFYMQAASGTKGGSSGSPVIDWQGRAVALNAGSKSSSASAFFLPLERWEAVTIPRGTLQVTFLHKGFDETRRLGLRSYTEQMVRNASPVGETGMLVVDSVVPGGPAHSLLEPGDVLVRINGDVITQFLKMETLLDDSVDRKIELQIERGGTPLTVDLTVKDLHSITPDYFLEVSGAVIHPLSYQQARNFCFHCGLVYVAEPGYMLFRAGVPRHAIIKKFGGEEISQLADLISVLSKVARGARVPLEYISYMDRHRRKSVLVTIDRHEWYAPPQIYTRDDSTGLWTLKPALPPESPLLSFLMNNVEQGLSNHTVPLDTGGANLMEHMQQDISQELTDGVSNMETSSEQVAEGPNSHDDSDVGTKKRRVEEDSSADSIVANGSLHEPREEKLEDSTNSENTILGDYQGAAAVAANASVAECVIEPTLVMFEVHVPPSCMLDGVHSQHFFGTGVVIYHSHNMGLVAVDKNTVAISVSDVMLSFAAFPIEIPGEVVFLHPVHNFALVAYDPSALGAVGASAVRAAELLPEPPLRRGDAVILVGLSRSLQATSRKSVVTNPFAALNIGSADCPRFRATNMEVIELDTDFGGTFSGVLTDEHGRVQAVWGSFSTQLKYGCSSSEDHQFVRGIPVYTISQVLDKIVSGANGSNLLINGIKRPMPLVRILEVEFYPTLLSKARSFGLSDKWVQALVKKDPIRRQVLRVKGCFAGSKAENLLEQGDMVLAINKEPITCFRDIEDACQALDQCDEIDGKLNMTIFRQGREIEILVGTDVRGGNGTTRVINWCGCIVQDPHPAVRALGFLPKEGHGVYVARWCHGSPVHRYGLYALQWIVEVNGKLTPDLDAFVDVTKEIEDGEFVRVRTVHLNGKPRVLTLKQDLHYWPTWEVRFDSDTAMWRRKIIKSLDRGIAGYTYSSDHIR
ncbi:Protease Do-like 7 [Camellia lanceoleosa]|uniref:Protease Do-like 7 n=1 Tax=Camellia lanceoleosa TaxID=1840588 RepID=A0ACC0HZF0_9ERIC|nr:Protease Do-like 7 [Camellia lanceoleosa]